MIEVPAAAALADVMLKEVDFVSIGTNDLIQYYLAVDRSNEFVTHLYKPFHPAVLRLIRSVIQAARSAGKDVVVCGEMAADTLSAIVLMGFGLRTFSMNPIFIPRVKKALRSIECRTAERIAEETLKLRSAQEIEEYVIEEILLRHPQVFLTGQPLEAGHEEIDSSSGFKEFPLSSLGSGYASCSPAPRGTSLHGSPRCAGPLLQQRGSRCNIPRHLEREARKWEKNQEIGLFAVVIVREADDVRFRRRGRARSP